MKQLSRDELLKELKSGEVLFWKVDYHKFEFVIFIEYEESNSFHKLKIFFLTEGKIQIDYWSKSNDGIFHITPYWR